MCCFLESVRVRLKFFGGSGVGASEFDLCGGGGGINMSSSVTVSLFISGSQSFIEALRDYIFSYPYRVVVHCLEVFI
jgi:hypothetical protein